MSIKAWLKRGVVSLVNASAKMKTLQVRLLADAVKDNVEHFEPYGFTSHPQPGAEVLFGVVGADCSHGVAFMVADRRFCVKSLKPGEIALYTDEGDTLIFKRGQHIEIKTKTFCVNATEKIELNAPLVQASEQLMAQGKFTAHAGLEVNATAHEGHARAATFHVPINTPDVVVNGQSVAHHRHAETGSITAKMQ